uniref:Uncharacterized protein n=1 Tax=Oryza brachyantha TaxID=4533 RepID=J3KU79_ORYBR
MQIPCQPFPAPASFFRLLPSFSEHSKSTQSASCQDWHLPASVKVARMHFVLLDATLDLPKSKCRIALPPNRNLRQLFFTFLNKLAENRSRPNPKPAAATTPA